LPLQKQRLVIISALYLFRGLGGIPLVLFAEHPYLKELNEKMTFMLVSSLVSLVFGILYTGGTKKSWLRLTEKNA
jgi:putative oxidoreductase